MGSYNTIINLYLPQVLLILNCVLVQSFTDPGQDIKDDQSKINKNNLKNVLMIIVDDLRPELGAYAGTDDALFSGIHTPYLDALAGQSMVFRNSYSQFAICGPSRSSFMTGRRPDTTRVVVNGGVWRQSGGNFTSIPQYFKENGYITYGAGKVYHGTSKAQVDNEYSWTADIYKPSNKDYWHADGLSWGNVTQAEYNNMSLPDMQTRDYVINRLRNVSNKEEPFFIAVGFEKPHLPMLAPIEFFYLYPEQDISTAANPHVPLNYPTLAWSGWTDMPEYKDMEQFSHGYNETLPRWKAIDMRRAYYASVSYTDSLIGELIQELTDLGMEDDTVVLFMSDHGYHLGEHSDWAKSTNYELDIRVPLIIKAPGVTDGGGFTNGLVEMVDVFPTLVDLAGLEPVSTCPQDSSKVLVCHEGHSMLDLITHPNMEWKTATFSQVFRDWKPAMGHSIQTSEYQYVRWVHYENSTNHWDTMYTEELYDLSLDPNQLENVAGYPEYASVQETMVERLFGGWRMAIPRV